MTRAMDRRRFLGVLGTATAASALAACTASTPRPTASPATASAAPTAAVPAGASARPDVVRLSTVVVPNDSGLYKELLPEFEKRSGLKVELIGGTTPHDVARAGKADIVLSHYQHEGVSPFMEEGFGEWPRMVFSSPGAIIGPPGDPARIRGLDDIVEAFTRIAKSGSTFIVNDGDGLKYVVDVAVRSAGIATGGWLIDKGVKGGQAMQAAAQAGGYTVWGLVPFLRSQQQSKLALEPLLMGDHLLKSVMITIVVSEKRVGGVNAKGARALQHYLLEPATQAKVRAFRMSGVTEQVWWPAAHDNENAAFATR
jgi:tungstate transport system substrate-binding protein